MGYRRSYLNYNAEYNLNSSLSNNRLFQYMAAGLPIISYNDERLNDIHQSRKVDDARANSCHLSANLLLKTKWDWLFLQRMRVVVEDL